MTKRFAGIAAEGLLKGLSDDDFARRAAVHIGELNAIHPFLEGNGRTNRAFLKILGHQAGKWIDLARIDPQAWNDTSRKAFLGQDEAMAPLIAGLIAGPATADPAVAVTRRPRQRRHPLAGPTRRPGRGGKAPGLR